jgi:uncharacterized protein (TIGR00251 family)
LIVVTPHAEGSIIQVRARPGAKQNAVLGERNGALMVAVSAAPERGKANEAIVEVLAQALQCKRSFITLMSGETSRDKKFLIQGLTPEALRQRLP